MYFETHSKQAAIRSARLAAALNINSAPRVSAKFQFLSALFEHIIDIEFSSRPSWLSR